MKNFFAKIFDKAKPLGDDDNITVISKNMVITGDFSDMNMMESLFVSGKLVTKTLKCKSVVIAKGGSVDGDITCDTIHISGQLKGNVVCHGVCKIDASATVEGNISTGTVIVDKNSALKITLNTGKKEDKNMLAGRVVAEIATKVSKAKTSDSMSPNRG